MNIVSLQGKTSTDTEGLSDNNMNVRKIVENLQKKKIQHLICSNRLEGTSELLNTESRLRRV